jgi:hypothetical protein
MSRFRTAGDDYLFDPRQKGSDLDSYYASKADQHGKVDDDKQDDDVVFDPRQKGSNLDDYMAQNQHLMEMKHQKKKPSFKIRRVK